MHPARRIRNRLIGIARRLRGHVERIRPEREASVELSTVKRRLDLLLRATFDQPLGDGIVANVPTAKTDERSIVLPFSVPESDDAFERFRLLAIEQGARIARGTRAHLPADPIERDIYMIVEGAAIDADLAARAPGLARSISRRRKEELERRPSLGWVSGVARPVEALLQQLLAAEPDASVSSIPRAATPAESAAAARELANEMRRAVKGSASYSAIRGIGMWDNDSYSGRAAYRPQAAPEQSAGNKQGGQEAREDVEESKSEKREDPEASDESREAQENEDGAAESPDDAAADTPDAAAARREELPTMPDAPKPGGVKYPEWVDRLKRLEPNYTTVFASDAPEGDITWARDALRDHAPVIRQLRDRFSLLRMRRLRLRAQRSGDELDLDACVNALIDIKLKRVPSDRLYQMSRPSRHPLAITILVDASGSTKELLPDGQRVIDVERLSVILASEALASLGDPFSILAFSGKSRHDVRISTIKDFGERDLSAMHARVSALEPDDNTRLGAAVRHATALLRAQPAQNRVLLILSDGRPHDVDWYWEAAAVEDSRVAILEARAAGVHSFCVTVDSKEADYLPHLFGDGRYWVLANPSELPKALIRLIDTILTG